ncbi:MAG: GNAT family N-acetyltransferase [Candidatus Methanomethylicia archaeon]
MSINFRRYVSGNEEGIVELMKNCFRTFNSWKLSVNDWLKYGDDDYGFKLENALVAEFNGKIVGHIQLMHRRIKIGKSMLDCGGIANVSTHPEYRRRGIATKLLSMAIEICKNNGWSISSLFTGYGSEGYNVYRSLGYADTTFIHEYVGTCERVRKALKILPKENVEIEEMKMENLEDVMRIYDDYSGKINGACWRPMDYWIKKIIEKIYYQSFFHENKDAGIRIIVKRDGEKIGYALAFNSLKASRSSWPSKECLILEVAAKRLSDRRIVLRELLSKLLSDEIKFFRMRIPRDPNIDETLKFFEEIKGAVYMNYITDQNKLFKDLKPEIENRLRKHGSELETKILIKTPYGEMAMKILGDEIDFCDIGEAENYVEFSRDGIAKLIYGIKGFRELLYEGFITGLKVDDEALEALNIMFPRRIFYANPIDEW